MTQWTKPLYWLVITAVLAPLPAVAQTWQAVSAQARGSVPAGGYFRLDQAALRAELAAAPHESLGDRSVQIQLPMPDGKLARFAVVESPIMEPGLAAELGKRPFTVRQYRDAAAIGRNVAIELLEYFDSRGFTRRNGDTRTVVGDLTRVTG